MVETTRNTHHHDLQEEKTAEEGGHLVRLLVDGANSDEVDRGGDGDEDTGQDRLKKEKLLAHLGGPISVEKGDG
jgi:hypothetical protein